MISGFVKDHGQEFTPCFGFAKDTQHEQIGMSFSFYKQIWPMVEVNNYYLIFDLNGVLTTTCEGQTKSHSIVLKPNLK
jgi:hypothetical protein